jgi:hypothetical protein
MSHREARPVYFADGPECRQAPFSVVISGLMHAMIGTRNFAMFDDPAWAPILGLTPRSVVRFFL